jgi:hypothetical protein
MSLPCVDDNVAQLLLPRLELEDDRRLADTLAVSNSGFRFGPTTGALHRPHPHRGPQQPACGLRTASFVAAPRARPHHEPGDALDVRSTGMNLSDIRLDDPDSFATEMRIRFTPQA